MRRPCGVHRRAAAQARVRVPTYRLARARAMALCGCTSKDASGRALRAALWVRHAGDAGLPPDRAPAPNAFRLRCALKLPPVPMIQWVGALTFFEPQCIMRPQERLCVSCFGALSAPWRLGIHSFTKLFTCGTFVRRTSAYRASAVSYHTIRPAALRCRHTRRTRIERTCARPCPCPARRCGAPYRHT